MLCNTRSLRFITVYSIKTALLWGIKMQIIDTNVVILVQDIHAASNQIIGTNNLVILVHDIHAASHQIKYLSFTAAASAL